MWGRGFLCIVGVTTFALLSADAWAGQKFGSRLNRQPTPAEECRDDRPDRLCSWVMTIAQNAPGRERAPKDGTIARIRILACSGGTFVLQVARADPANERARVIRSGPLINYRGHPDNCGEEEVFRIETFRVNVPVRKGDYLAVVGNKIGFIYNASGDGTLVFDRPLADGARFRRASEGTGSGILMLEAEYTD